MTAFLAHRETFARVGSTNDIVRDWLADGVAEVCLAVAIEQTDGRGRDGRRWLAPPGAALLLSLGFRPSWSPATDVWQLAAVISLAFAEAAESALGIPPGTIRLKWPNDLVVEVADGSPADRLGIRKLAGVLGETDGLGTADPRVVVGLGVNTDWTSETFPQQIAASMTSLREIADGRPVDDEVLLDAFLTRLQASVERLRRGDGFDAAGWSGRQVTTGRQIRIEQPDGSLDGIGAGVDPSTGALLFVDPSAPDSPRSVVIGEVSHVRVADPYTVGV